MQKRALSLLLALVMVIGLLPVTVHASRLGTLDNGLVYRVYLDHIVIDDYFGDSTSVVVPAVIEGLPVTSIGFGAFSNCISLTSVVLPDSITSIDNNAFTFCDSLSSIILPDSITSIGNDAFACCISLTSIDLPDSLTSLSNSIFSTCTNLTNIDLPDNLTSIGDSAFIDCSSLTSIDLPDGVTFIGQYSFYGCTSLSNIDLPYSITSIDKYAFAQCSNLTSIHFESNAPTFGNKVFYATTANAYYPASNSTWTADVMQNYGGNITWIPYGDVTLNNPFTDVPAGAFYEAPVLWALENGITTGATADTFNPNGSCLRAHVVTFLHRAAGNPDPVNASNPFGDVKASDFFYKPVLWAVEKGITNGTGAATFGSYDVCNRAAVVTFLWRAAGSPEPESTSNPFVDVKTTDFFYKPVLWAIENGITNGVDATHFGPTSPCNRAQVVTFLYRAYN